MAKSANDNMMTRPQLHGSWGRVLVPHHPSCVLSWSGDGTSRKSLVESRGKAPVGDLDWRRSPQKF